MFLLGPGEYLKTLYFIEADVKAIFKKSLENPDKHLCRLEWRNLKTCLRLQAAQLAITLLTPGIINLQTVYFYFFYLCFSPCSNMERPHLAIE